MTLNVPIVAMKKLLISLSILFLTSTLSAQKILINGIYYQIKSDSVVDVTRGDQPYAGHLVVPATIGYNGLLELLDSLKAGESYGK